MASARLIPSAMASFCRAFGGPASLLVRMVRLKKPITTADVPEKPQPPAADVSEPPKPESPEGFQGAMERVFGIDTRSLALFRICLGLIMIGDLLYRAQDLRAHYTDAGILPIALVSLTQQQHWWWTIHTLHPALAAQVVLFLIAGVCSLMLAFGYRTRMFSVICWLLLVSLQNRNTMILTGGDGMLRLLTFWAMFLPLGTRWSVDRAMDKTGAPPPKRIYSIGSIALVTQLCIIYLFGALLKTGPTWRTDHTAIYYALSLGQFATPLAKFLLHYPEQLKTLTFFTWNLEFLGAFLVVASAFSGPLRTLVVLIFMGFHISLGLCLELGLFPIIGALAWLVLLPDWFWRNLSRLSARLPGLKPPPFFADLGVKGLRPQLPDAPTPRAIQGLCVFFLVYVICWNVRMTNFKLYTPLFPITWNWIGEVTRIDQSWELFAPNPTAISEWMVVPAELLDGEKVDLKTQLPQSDTQPALISSTYYNERWRKYLMNLSEVPERNQCFAYASYLSNRWNESHSAERRVISVSIYAWRSKILPTGGYAQATRELLFEGNYKTYQPEKQTN